MGVDYSTTVGYGFYGSDKPEDLPQALKDLADGDYLGEEHVSPWLAGNGLDLLDMVTIGNRMSGPTYWFIYLKPTYIHYDIYDQDGVHAFGEINPSAKARDQLGRVRILLNWDDPQWVVSFNVS